MSGAFFLQIHRIAEKGCAQAFLKGKDDMICFLAFRPMRCCAQANPKNQAPSHHSTICSASLRQAAHLRRPVCSPTKRLRPICPRQSCRPRPRPFSERIIFLISTPAIPRQAGMRRSPLQRCKKRAVAAPSSEPFYIFKLFCARST